MNMLRAFSPGAVLVFCVFAALVSAAQDPGAAASPPPVIQGPPGGPLALPAAPGGDAAGPGPLKFKMYALLGQKKSTPAAGLDPELKPLEEALKGLPYTDYAKISIDERETPDGVETQFPINAAYTMVVQPNGTDEQGAAKVGIHVDLMQSGKFIKALTAEATAKPGDALLLRGMPLPPGELVIVFQRDPGKQDSQGGQSDQDKKDQQQQQQQDQKNESKDSEKQQDQKKEDEKKEAEKKEAKEDKADQKDEKDKEADDKKDTKNLESILQSLEDVDRKEQAEVRNKRDRIDFKGDWW